MLKLKNLALLVAVTGLLVGPAMARTEGSLSGIVKDGSGNPLPGVTVKVESDQLLGGSKSVTSDAQGNYRFPALPPGVYKVTAELFGFKSYKAENVQIEINQPKSLDPVLAPEGVEIGVSVTAHEDIVEPEKTQTSTVLNNEFVDNIPVLGRSYQTLLLIAPGVLNHDGLGSTFGGGNVNSHGARSDANQYLFDGGNTGDTSYGVFGQNFNQDAVDQIEVITAGYKAEYGRSDGAIANVLTKSGGNDFEGSFRVDIRDSSLDNHGSGKTAIQGRDTYRHYFSATLGGPFIKDRFWFFASAYYQDRKELTIFSSGTYPVQDSPAEIYDYFAKLTYQINDDHQLLFSFHHDPATFHDAYADPSYPESFREQQEQGGYVYLLKETAVFSPNVFLESLVNIMDGNELHVGPDSNSHPNPAPFNGYDRSTDTYFGQRVDRTDTNRDRTQFREDLSVYIDDAIGTHDLKFGVSYDLELNNRSDEQAGEFYTLENGVFVSKTFPSTDPKFTTLQSTHARVAAIYAQDSWTPREGLIFNLGVRFDWQEIEFNGLTGYPDVFLNPNLTFDDMHWTVDTVSDNAVAPRLGFSYDPKADGKNVIRGSASRFNSTIPGFAGKWDRGTIAYPQECTTDAAGNCVSTDDIAPQYYFLLDRNIKMPYTDEFTLGYEREIIPELAVGITAIWRKGHDLLQDIDRNVFFTDTDGDGIAETRNRYNPNFTKPFFVLGNNNRSEYKGVELTVRKRLDDNWQLLGSYTYSKAEGDGEWGATAEGDDPRSAPFEYSYQSYDQRHVVKIDGTYFLPLDFIVSASARYISGTPYSITGKAFDDLNGNGVPDPGEVPAGSPGTFVGKRNSLRNDNYFDLNLRGEKDFVFKGITLGIFGDAFNVLNNQAVVDTTALQAVDGLGTVTKKETKRFGRRFQLGLRVSF
ncbi:MAG: TonB-dependent receptor [Acidobacteriota bacterium]